MAYTNPRSALRPLRDSIALRVANPNNGSEVDGNEDSSRSECYQNSPYDEFSSEYDSDDLSLKERIRWRAGAISPYTLPYSNVTTPSPPPPPRYSPSGRLDLRGTPASCERRDTEELDINYLGILSPPPRVLHNPHPSHYDYGIPDRVCVRDFLETPGYDDLDEVKEPPQYPLLDVDDFVVRPPPWTLQPTKPLRIRRRRRPDPPAMHWDPTNQSMQHSYSLHSIYSQDSHLGEWASQYRSCTHPPSMRPAVSTTGSETAAFVPNSFSSSRIYGGETEKFYPRTHNMASNQSSDLVSSQYHRSRRRGPLHLDRYGLSLIDEQKESTFTPPERRPPHPWDSDEHCPQTVISQQPGHHPPMSPKRRVGDRNAKGMSYAADGKRDWSSDLCMFCDHNLGTCCAALWCPCIIYARNKRRIEHLYVEEKVHPTRGGTCSDDCAIHACMSTFCLFGWAIQIPNRAAVRRRYDIEGDCIGDCAAAFFCSSCELSQESREIDLEERTFGDVHMWSNG